MKENHQFPQKVLDFIRHHENTDPYSLALKASPFSEVSMKTIVQQIQGKKIAKRKFPFLLKFDQYQYPVKESLEQASSEKTALYKSNLIEGKRFVDLTGGMGIDTYILGRKFESCTYIEPNTDLFALITQNFITLNYNQCKTLNLTCSAFLAANQTKFDWAYIDPSRRIGGKRKISIYNYDPNLVDLAPQIGRIADNIMVKLSPMQDISECVNVLENVHRIWILSVGNEVKELLLHLKKDSNPSPMITAVDLNKTGIEEFTYSFEDRSQKVNIGRVKKYLYQPSAAIVKSQLQDRYALQRGLEKLNPNTQLYTSDKFIDDYFGKVFLVKQNINLKKESIKNALPEMKANVITKNFPLSPQELIKKFKLKKGGENFLIAYSDFEDCKLVSICCKVC